MSSSPRARRASACAASTLAVLVVAPSAPAVAQEAVADLPVAVANDNRTPAGRMVDGVLHVELETVEAAWYPRGPDGPRVVTPAFAEVGGPPMVPGPLLRAPVGVPMRVTVHNRLAGPVSVRGLVDRATLPDSVPGAVGGVPRFFFADPLEIGPGQRAERSFSGGAEVSSFYYGRRLPGEGPPWLPGGLAEDGAFVGGLVVDPAGGPASADERVFLLTRWATPEEPGTGDTWKVFINGRSWPYTERLGLTVGDTARWRVVNTSAVSHPMHLHGFYFDVEAVGDTEREEVYGAADVRSVVTEPMSDFSSVRLRWVPRLPGNWLFHCHLVRHMGEMQRFQVERDADAGAHAHGDAGADPAMDMATMAGMILGITVAPDPDRPVVDAPPVRRIDLWTGSRAGAFENGAPALAFVTQADGDPVPAPDSVPTPSSPLVLVRGEPTEIVLHNRLDFPLSVHWHGLEVRSLYDGVGNWSGTPGSVRPPIPPGGEQRVVIDAPRAGTFFYHTHGEPGHELAQGLYGAFLVLEPGSEAPSRSDRVFVLGSRGAEVDPDPAVNAMGSPPAERFTVGEPVRLRFAHISPDDQKRIRIVREGETGTWTPWAKDGADLPDARRTPGPAEVTLGVGEAFDALWRPDAPGVHVMEVHTLFYPARGGTHVQRIGLAVGDVPDAEVREAITGTRELLAERAPFAAPRAEGAYGGSLDGAEARIFVWSDGDGVLRAALERGGRPGEDRVRLFPLAAGGFLPAEEDDGRVVRPRPDRYAFAVPAGSGDAAELTVRRGGRTVGSLRRIPDWRPPAEALESLAGRWAGSGIAADVTFADGVLRFQPDGAPEFPLQPLSPTLFRVDGPGALVEVDGASEAVRLLLHFGSATLALVREAGAGAR